MLERREMGRQFSVSSGDPLFLKTGITLASLSLFRKTPVEKKSFIMLERIVDSLFRFEKIIVEEMLHEPEDLLVPKDDKEI